VERLVPATPTVGEATHGARAVSWPRFEVTSRAEAAATIVAGALHREGVFQLHFILAMAVGIPLLALVAGFGERARRREVGILKATGWQTDEVVLRAFVEGGLLALVGAALAVVGAFAWLSWLNGWWLASVFLPGLGTVPSVRVPLRLAPATIVIVASMAVVLVMAGTLYATWRCAITPPSEALRG
jgi:ABC-type lipoprotein release transport system permease subunit